MTPSSGSRDGVLMTTSGARDGGVVGRRDRGSNTKNRRRRQPGGVLPKNGGAVPGSVTNGPSLALLLVLLACTSPAVSAQDVEQLHILAPLYARPEGEFWSHIVESAQNTTVSYSVVINPSSGPGDSAEDAYTTGINELLGVGVEVLCYVPTGFGQTDVTQVTADVDKYESFYPGMCDGFFFDEGPGSYENTWKYTEYYTHVQEVSGAGSTVVVNPGIRPDISLYHIGDVYETTNPSMGGQVVITSFENHFLQFYDGSQDYTNQEVPFPIRFLTDRYLHSIMVYGAYFTTLQEFLDDTVFKLYCANWGYVFFTDDSFGDDGNPWDSLPGYFSQLLLSVERAMERAGECGTLAPTAAPTPMPTLPPVAPGETRAPVPTPSPTEFTTVQPAAIGGTRAPLIPPPTPAPTPSPTTPSPTPAPTMMPTPAPTLAPTSAPTLAPTSAPTVSPTAMPTPAPTLAPTPEEEGDGSGAGRGAKPYSASATWLLSGAVLLATVLYIGA